MKFPITLQYLPGVTAEAVKELHDYDIGVPLDSVVDHASVFFPVVTASRHHIHEVANGQEVVTLAVSFVPAFLGFERVVLVPGLARGGDPQVPDRSLGCECGVQVSILLLI